jgi:hypothetical protein
MPLQYWNADMTPDGIAPIPDDIRIEIESIRDLLTMMQPPTTTQMTVLSSLLLAEMAKRLDTIQLNLSRANSLIAQQDMEEIRQRVEDAASELDTIPIQPSVISQTFAEIEEIVSDIELILEENGQLPTKGLRS